MAAYAAFTIALTWPVARGITHDVPFDLGDPLLNMWILAWNAEALPRLVTGAISIADYWNANLFHPEPLALARSEHLFGPALQILPFYHLVDNSILCYNLLFLSSFWLCALGMYFLVKDLTGHAGAAFVAGLIYAFMPTRFGQMMHLPMLSGQWMPFALLGLRRYIITDRPMALLGAIASWLMLNWSSGYLLLFFAIFVPPFVLYQLHAARRLRDRRVWIGLVGAGLVTLAGTVPFLLPYRELQRLEGFQRSLEEVEYYGADVLSYLTAPYVQTFYGKVVRAYVKDEGEIFLGFVPMALGVVAVVLAATRTPLRRLAGVPAVFFAILAVVAIWLSCGPTVKVAGQPVPGLGLYYLLHTLVPGFEGLRVPSRLALMAGLFLSIAAGYAIADLARRSSRPQLVVAAVGVLFMIDAVAVPVPLNHYDRVGPGYPRQEILPAHSAPAVYHHLATLPRGSVIAELPMRDLEWEIRYVYYSTVHWQPIVNGYSGVMPDSFIRRLERLREVRRLPQAAWSALAEAGTTHVVVHAEGFPGRGELAFVETWLTGNGARRIETFPDGSQLYALPWAPAS